MTSNEILTTYESLSELTGTMLDAARIGDWDNLTELEHRCKGYVSHLTQATTTGLNATEQRARVAIIRAILKNDAEIRALVDPRMDELQGRLRMAHVGRHIAETYGAQRA